MAVNQKAVKVLNKVLEAGFTDEKAIAAMTMDDILSMQGITVADITLGLCQKSMFVVPNHLVGQWASEYLRLYPSANILVTTKRDFETGNRKKFCGRIATGDYDAVIIGHAASS